MTLPRTFTDASKVTHVQWPKDGVHGVVMACGYALGVLEHWDKNPRPTTCLACAAKSR